MVQGFLDQPEGERVHPARASVHGGGAAPARWCSVNAGGGFGPKAGTLGDYSEGLIGPGHCDIDGFALEADESNPD